ncbi:hypothetical protein G3N96_32455 [Burkholderia sp. Se-20373]|uniref:hypothetical protein n=1 Tax=Burkholderia sp. Se-20373 TaxID=2703898 RepID=UPI0019812A16|nr:hypothetical protein [Burkholderia sp. Se-20373]MBN3750097.1 hypothetical protein [Burkholderia sp. Se-20373]
MSKDLEKNILGLAGVFRFRDSIEGDVVLEIAAQGEPPSIRNLNPGELESSIRETMGRFGFQELPRADPFDEVIKARVA